MGTHVGEPREGEGTSKMRRITHGTVRKEKCLKWGGSERKNNSVRDRSKGGEREKTASSVELCHLRIR